MAENDIKKDQGDEVRLEGGTYEVIRNRLETHSKGLQGKLSKLNVARKDVFGAVENKLVSSERISTGNNCIPRDMVPLDHHFIFGYNVFVGLRTETVLSDVFAVYKWQDGVFVADTLSMIEDERFIADFKNLYKYYRQSAFVKFAVIGPHLFMVFRIGNAVTDIKTFKWLIRDNTLEYLDNRSDHEYVFPTQHQFEWRKVTQDMHRNGTNPHASIEDIVFVEAIGGDLTIKIEDNTKTGEGIYSEPVDDPDQTLNDAEIYYALIGNVVLLKIRPYQEKDFRYIVYNRKVENAVRVDSIKDACVFLPEDHGLVFPRGYYLQTGELKQFDTNMDDMIFEKRISSPNGEDFLYIFYNRMSGVYVLLSYNLIEQKMAVPVVCNGYSFFEDGTLIYFRGDGEAQKHHVIQVWKTPFYGIDFTIEVKNDSELYKIGNKSIVRCMAECMELVNLVGREDTYADLYVDITKKAEDIRDSYFWLDTEGTFELSAPLMQIKEAASAAIDEFEKVVRTRKNTRKQIWQVSAEVRELIDSVDYNRLGEIGEYVGHLAKLRAVRGQVVSLHDLRYADEELIAGLEKEVINNTEKLSGLCVEFLLKPESLDPYMKQVKEQGSRIGDVAKVSVGRELQAEVEETAGELEMLTEIVSNLKIDDATQTVAIIDNISLVYSQVNQVKSSLKNKIKDLAGVEGKAEFASQIKLIDQSVINYLDICDTPDKCDEYLTKSMVQLETLESRFADFDEFIVELSEKREELYNAFESRKVQLVSERNQRASALMAAAERILKGIGNRVKGFKDVNEINGYFASDMMIERVRETIEKLVEIGDSVKAEDVKTQLKTLQQNSIRQLKDRQALYEDGENIIRLGSHRFSVNKQTLEGTIVQRQGGMFYHLTGTGFFMPVVDEEFLATRDVWSLELVSESADIYRSEYLAFKMMEAAADNCAGFLGLGFDEVVSKVQAFMGPRFDEGYVKGVHDHDTAKILVALVELGSRVGLLRYPSQARALGVVFWDLFDDAAAKELIGARIRGAGDIGRLFTAGSVEAGYIIELGGLIGKFVERSGLFDVSLIGAAAEYLYQELAGGGEFVASKVAADIVSDFKKHLRAKDFVEGFSKSIEAVSADAGGKYLLIRQWICSYLEDNAEASLFEYGDEAAALIFGEKSGRLTIDESVERELDGLVGSHGSIAGGVLKLNYCHFMTRVLLHEDSVVPKFVGYQKFKKELVEMYADQLRLDEFRPRVLSTFVRNKLIDKVYLPLLGDNLAKQIGSADDNKRTDCQGLLLLISPPGYGKTTLMEYMANRLGLIFMKINGPAIGHGVTSFDPGEAPNAAAREELNKLNLAFEMGDNVMIYVDDIQHTNPEFLQKFISLCDAQRRVEGVYNGKSQTYDLRGKRVCVVMAGNPYTESGEKFRIPDMLSNRADIYNIGDIVGDNYNEFIMSYVENSLTCNPVLEKLAQRSQQDVYAIMKIAETGQQDGIDFEGNYSVDEIKEYVSTMKKLNVVREVILKVNTQYIASAGQADEYRTEPPFLLQGSYRNMNRITSKVLPVMNDAELWTLIFSSYEQDSQTLTTGAEANMLKFREMLGKLDSEQLARWNDIKKRFGRNQLLGGDDEDKVGKIIRQLNSFGAGLDSIKDAVAGGMSAMAEKGSQELKVELPEFKFEMPEIKVQMPEVAALPVVAPKDDISADQFKQIGREVLGKISEVIAAVKKQGKELAAHEEKEQALQSEQNSRMLVSVLEEQFRTMETWLTPVHHGNADRAEYFKSIVDRFETMQSGYTKLIKALKRKYEPLQSAKGKKRKKDE